MPSGLSRCSDNVTKKQLKTLVKHCLQNTLKIRTTTVIALLKILSSLRFLGRQGLPIRGDGDETDGNYIQLLTLRGEDDSRMLEWLKRKNEKYTCAEVQNEMLQIMALSVLRDIAQNIRNSVYYSIMADETTDVSNREQCVLVLRHVDDDHVAHEDFIGLYKVDSIDSNTLTKTIEDCLLRMNLSLKNCRGQCYDGASNMSGAKNGVAKQIIDKEARGVYTHCYGHALNLAVGDTVKQSKVMRDALDTTYEMSKLVMFSPKRDSLFEKLKQIRLPGLGLQSYFGALTQIAVPRFMFVCLHVCIKFIEKNKTEKDEKKNRKKK